MIGIKINLYYGYCVNVFSGSLTGTYDFHLGLDKFILQKALVRFYEKSNTPQ